MPSQQIHPMAKIVMPTPAVSTTNQLLDSNDSVSSTLPMTITNAIGNIAPKTSVSPSGSLTPNVITPNVQQAIIEDKPVNITPPTSTILFQHQTKADNMPGVMVPNQGVHVFDSPVLKSETTSPPPISISSKQLIND